MGGGGAPYLQGMPQERAEEIEEMLIATLPGMKKRERDKAPYDLIYMPNNEKIEFKYSGLRDVQYATGFSGQLSWGNIARREFSWLLLCGDLLENGLLFWLLPECVARYVLTKSGGGQITFVPDNAVPRRRKAAMIDLYRITLEELRARCEKGGLGAERREPGKVEKTVRVLPK